MVFSGSDMVLVGLIFVWTGFVRTGLGFGGAALGLPLMLLIGGTPVYWLPIVGMHLLLFSSLTLFNNLLQVDWRYIKQTLVWILPASFLGIAGLVTLPDKVMVIFVYAVTLFYAFIWLFDKAIHSSNKWVDRFLLLVGGYVVGTSLTGAPLIVAVYLRHVDKNKLRNTLMVLWFFLVSIKLITLAAVGVDFDWWAIVWLMPGVAIGHVIGLKLHDRMMDNDVLFKRIVGAALMSVSILGLLKTL